MYFFSESFPSVASMHIQLNDLVSLAARCAFVIIVVAVVARLAVEVAYLVHTKILKPARAGKQLKGSLRRFVKGAQSGMR